MKNCTLPFFAMTKVQSPLFNAVFLNLFCHAVENHWFNGWVKFSFVLVNLMFHTHTHTDSRLNKEAKVKIPRGKNLVKVVWKFLFRSHNTFERKVVTCYLLFNFRKVKRNLWDFLQNMGCWWISHPFCSNYCKDMFDL